MSLKSSQTRHGRPALSRTGRFVVACSSILMLALSGLDASAADYVEPKSITPPAATGDVPEPDGYRTDGYRMPVPRTLKGATVIDADAAEKLIKDSNGTIFLDVYPRAPKPANLPAGTVWRDMPHSSIAGAHWLPNVGYGVLSPEFETYFKTRLATLTENDKSKPLVFFCLKDCWMSWNAAKRALSWGYSSVMWFPDGTDGWQGIGNDLIAVTPLP